MTEITAFNSGRFYGPDHQRIAYCIHEGHLMFVDIDRHIEGRWPLPCGNLISSPKTFMKSYDMGGYESIGLKYSQLKSRMVQAARQQGLKAEPTTVRVGKGMYVRLIENNDEGDDCGVSTICHECYEKSHFSADSKYWYWPWEEDMEGDTGPCRECGCQAY